MQSSIHTLHSEDSSIVHAAWIAREGIDYIPKGIVSGLHVTTMVFIFLAIGMFDLYRWTLFLNLGTIQCSNCISESTDIQILIRILLSIHTS